MPLLTEGASIPLLTEDASIPLLTEGTSIPLLTEGTSIPLLKEGASIPLLTEGRFSTFAYRGALQCLCLQRGTSVPLLTEGRFNTFTYGERFKYFVKNLDTKIKSGCESTACTDEVKVNVSCGTFFVSLFLNQ